jgi:hypothetical protein
LTALLPPPPIPITFIIDDFSLGRSKWIIRIDLCRLLIATTDELIF